MPKCTNCGFIFRYEKCPRCGTPADVKNAAPSASLPAQKIEENKSELNQFFEMVCSITTTSDVDSVLKKVGAAAEKLTLTMASSIMLLDDDKKNLYFKVASGDKGTILTKLKVPVGEGIAGWVAANKEPLIIQDVSVDPRFTGKIDSEHRGGGGEPLKYRSIKGLLIGLSDIVVRLDSLHNKSHSLG